MKNANSVYLNRLQWSKANRIISLSILHQLLINPYKLKNHKQNISIKFKPSYINSYSMYQKEIIGIIRRLREDNKSFIEISKVLNSKKYKSIRNKQFTPPLIERIYKKHLIKIKREFEIEIDLI